KNVQATELRRNGFDEPARGRRIGNIHRLSESALAGFQEPERFVRSWKVQIGHDDGRSLASVNLADSPPQPSSSSHDTRHSALQSSAHGFITRCKEWLEFLLLTPAGTLT